ncbi:MAG: hypothetical protein QM662_02475 [Gordonia sp. (in: high G+C Gram-positive bacteria)]
MTLHVVVGVRTNPAGGVDEDVEEWAAPEVSFLTEPSGALVIFRRPNDQWAAYAPGCWMKVREVIGGGQD